ncbi:unnamed protein product [Caenorhabditis nigoni]
MTDRQENYGYRKVGQFFGQMFRERHFEEFLKDLNEYNNPTTTTTTTKLESNLQISNLVHTLSPTIRLIQMGNRWDNPSSDEVTDISSSWISLDPTDQETEEPPTLTQRVSRFLYQVLCFGLCPARPRVPELKVTPPTPKNKGDSEASNVVANPMDTLKVPRFRVMARENTPARENV